MPPRTARDPGFQLSAYDRQHVRERFLPWPAPLDPMQQSELDGGRDCPLGGADADTRPTGKLAMRTRAPAVDAGLVSYHAEDGLLTACEVLSDLGRQPAGRGEAAAVEE